MLDRPIILTPGTQRLAPSFTATMPSLDYTFIADLYDRYVTTNLDIPFFLKQSSECGRVLELMSGTGRVSIPLLEAGVSLTCVDSSPAMLSRLREKAEVRGLHADIREMDVCALHLGGVFDLIILPFHSFAEIVEPSMQLKALAGIRKHLEQRGRFICPLHNPSVRTRVIDGVKRTRGEFAAGKHGEKLVLSSVETCSTVPGIVRGTQYYDMYSRNKELLQHREVKLCFYLHTPELFGKLVEKEGFRVREVYGDYSCGPFKAEESAFMIWVLE